MKPRWNFVAVAVTALASPFAAFAQAPVEASQPAASQPDASVVQTTTPPNRTVYSPRLPTPQELSNDAANQHLTITRIDETAAQVIVTYRDDQGQTTTTVYQLLPTANATASSVPVPSTPAPKVVYVPATRVVYYDYDPYYYYGPWYSYPRVSLGIGFGLGYRHHGGFYHGGGFHGGYHHWHR